MSAYCLNSLVPVQKLGSSKSPRSSSQRVSSPSRKRQCSGFSHADDENNVKEEAEEDAATADGSVKRADNGRVDLQAVAAGL